LRKRRRKVAPFKKEAHTDKVNRITGAKNRRVFFLPLIIFPRTTEGRSMHLTVFLCSPRGLQTRQFSPLLAVRNSGMDIFWIRIRNGCGAHMSRRRGDREVRVVRSTARTRGRSVIFWSRMRRCGIPLGDRGNDTMQRLATAYT
jgi:hypothetical protein